MYNIFLSQCVSVFLSVSLSVSLTLSLCLCPLPPPSFSLPLSLSPHQSAPPAELLDRERTRAPVAATTAHAWLVGGDGQTGRKRQGYCQGIAAATARARRGKAGEGRALFFSLRSEVGKIPSLHKEKENCMTELGKVKEVHGDV